MKTERTSDRPRWISMLGACTIATASLFSQDGVLDITFSSDGQYGFMPQIPDVITVDILETGGTIFSILSGVNGATSSYILKLNSDGSLATGSVDNGILEYPNAGFVDAALSHDETRIFLLGGPTSGYQISSIDLNGTVDVPWTPVNSADGGGGFAKMLVDDQGRICIGKGASINGVGYGQVIRLNEDFTPDSTFGNNGIAYTPAAPFGYPLFEIDNQGRMVLASYLPGGIWRFNTDGTVDASFNYTLDLASYSLDNWILDIAIAQDNSIYVQPNTWGWPAYLFKLLEDGSLNTGFGTGGYMDLSDADPLYYIAPDELLIEPGGGLIVLAQGYAADGYMSAKYLTRLDENGVIDPEFDPGIQPIDDNGYDLRINFHCATLQEDGKVLSMDQVVKWQNGALFGYAPLITRFTNEKGAIVASVNDAGPREQHAIAFPNPTSGTVTMRAPAIDAWQNATAVITNSVGAVVLEEQLVNGTIDLSALACGVYTCLVQHAGGSVHARIVKE